MKEGPKKNLEPTKVFSPQEALKRIKKIPKPARKEAIQEFKRHLVLQREGWAQCRSAVEREAASHPDISRSALMDILLSYREDYSFGDEEMGIAIKIIDEYLFIRERVSWTRKKYPDDRELIRYLTAIDCSDMPSQAFEVTLGPMSIDIAIDAAYFHRYSKNQESAGFASGRRLSTVPFTVINRDASARSAHVVPHEQQHIKTDLFHSFLYPKKPMHPDIKPHIYKGIKGFFRRKFAEISRREEDSYLGEIYHIYLIEQDPYKKRRFLREFCLALRDKFYRCAANEILSVLSEPDEKGKFNLQRVEDDLTTSDGFYDYLKPLQNNDTFKKDPDWEFLSKQLLIDEYRSTIHRAIAACDNLIDSRYYRPRTDDHPKKTIIAILTDEPLPRWPLVAKRSIELQDLAHSAAR